MKWLNVVEELGREHERAGGQENRGRCDSPDGGSNVRNLCLVTSRLGWWVLWAVIRLMRQGSFFRSVVHGKQGRMKRQW